MKNLFVAAFVLGLAYSSNAQSEDKLREVGFSFSNLDNFSLVYRFGNESSLWRISLLNLRANLQPENDLGNKNVNTSLGFRMGKEWRSPISEKFKFRYGGDLMTSFNYSNSSFDEDDFNKSRSMRTGLIGILGFNYSIGKGLIFGAELLPGITYAAAENVSRNGPQSEEQTSFNSSYNFNLDNSLELSLVYQF